MLLLAEPVLARRDSTFIDCLSSSANGSVPLAFVSPTRCEHKSLDIAVDVSVPPLPHSPRSGDEPPSQTFTPRYDEPERSSMGSPASVTYVRVSYEANGRADMGYLEVWTDLHRSHLQHRSLWHHDYTDIPLLHRLQEVRVT